jgi:uncharacterized protein YbbC (DUF1343 family)/CubicO group peptidase (beta-lactamase class C family)
MVSSFLREYLMNLRSSAVQPVWAERLSRRWNRRKHMLVFILLVGLVMVLATPIHATDPFAAQADFLDMGRLGQIDEIVEKFIREGKLPGAVVVVGQHDRIHYRKAFGNRAVIPSTEPMTVDTVFDLGSLTKVVATTSSVMLLVEQGRICLNTPVADYIPDFERYGKSTITVRHLLTHMSGLRPGLVSADPWQGYDTAILLATNQVPLAKPDKRFIYSDINFLLLGEIVRRVSGMSLDQFARIHLFEPLDMWGTGFNPPAEQRAHIAPTERCWKHGKPCGGPEGTMLRGLVHDSTARRMGGVAGHAGLFSTADDLANYCSMLLNGGAFGKKRIFSPPIVTMMITPWTPAAESDVRGLGWDLDVPHARESIGFPALGPFGHTGFTGTLLWLDPVSGLYVVFLSNRLHPNGRGDVKALRAEVVTIAASALTHRRPSSVRSIPPRPASVLTGIDVLQAEAFARMQGKRVGLLTNQTGQTRTGARTIDLIYAARNVKLVALFSPEHGIGGMLSGSVPSSRDSKTKIPIYSLYGKHRRPTAKMLEGIDTIVVDLQDIGTRFYTYMTTVAYVMEEAARQKIDVLVLDRPNPINGEQIEGPTLDRSDLGFTGYFPMPIRHGMTMGELALLFKGENHMDVDLTVVKLRGWQRKDWFDHTGLPWVNPSPNIRSLIQAILYPGIGAIEGTNLSVGRGTDAPFEQIGAPWIDGVRLAAELNARALPGVRLYPVSFTPTTSKYAGESCQGVYLLVTNRLALRPVHLGLEIAATLYHLYPEEYRLEADSTLLGSVKVLDSIQTGEDPAQVAKSWEVDAARWHELRKRYLLY